MTKVGIELLGQLKTVIEAKLHKLDSLKAVMISLEAKIMELPSWIILSFLFWVILQIVSGSDFLTTACISLLVSDPKSPGRYQSTQSASSLTGKNYIYLLRRACSAGG